MFIVKKLQIVFGVFIMKELILLLQSLQVKTNKFLQHRANALHTSVNLSTYKIEQLNSKIQMITRFYFAKTFFQKVQVQYILKILIILPLLLINSVHLKVNLLYLANFFISKEKSTVQSSKDQFVMEDIVQ